MEWYGGQKQMVWNRWVSLGLLRPYKWSYFTLLIQLVTLGPICTSQTAVWNIQGKVACWLRFLPSISNDDMRGSKCSGICVEPTGGFRNPPTYGKKTWAIFFLGGKGVVGKNCTVRSSGSINGFPGELNAFIIHPQWIFQGHQWLAGKATFSCPTPGVGDVDMTPYDRKRTWKGRWKIT